MPRSLSPVRFTSVEFSNFKALRQFSVALDHVNILVGPNNCGKSTVIGAFRALEIALRRARTQRPVRLNGLDGHPLGYQIGESALPISIENVAFEYHDVEARVAFRTSSGHVLTLRFPVGRQMYLVADGPRGTPQSAAQFKIDFPVAIVTVPPLGPVEHEEPLVERETVRSNLHTHRASRHFRNYWHYYAEGFDIFAAMIADTWPGMEIEPPELILGPPASTLAMFCKEHRVSRELFWAGVGFQVWCQLLTHLSRAQDASLIVLDEPEIYLHPDVQRQLLGLLRGRGPDVLLATHSAEIMSEADPEDIMIVDKTYRSARRVRDVEGVQGALDAVGSMQNVTLTQLWSRCYSYSLFRLCADVSCTS
jgi:energy-coupling factor transporter ATP-binding protein EcfA2